MPLCDIGPILSYLNHLTLGSLAIEIPRHGELPKHASSAQIAQLRIPGLYSLGPLKSLSSFCCTQITLPAPPRFFQECLDPAYNAENVTLEIGCSFSPSESISEYDLLPAEPPHIPLAGWLAGFCSYLKPTPESLTRLPHLKYLAVSFPAADSDQINEALNSLSEVFAVRAAAGAPHLVLMKVEHRDPFANVYGAVRPRKGDFRLSRFIFQAHCQETESTADGKLR